jgi:hypothetical protein
MTNHHLKLRPEPDGYGYIYGELEAGGQSYRVNIMPPESEWRDDFKLPGDGAPHPTDYKIFIDGEEIARVRRREDIPAIITRRLLAPPR